MGLCAPLWNISTLGLKQSEIVVIDVRTSDYAIDSPGKLTRSEIVLQ
jgi:hypothetical protein